MKKKILFMLILMGVMLYVPSVMAASVNITGCSPILEGISIDVKIANTVKTIILVIQIVVPVVLVIFGMLDLFKAVIASKEDEIKKGLQIFIKRLIAAAVVFSIIAIVKLLVSFVADDPNIMTCANCFLNGADPKTGSCKGEDDTKEEEETKKEDTKKEDTKK